MKRSTLVPVVAPLVCAALFVCVGVAFAATLPQPSPAVSAQDPAGEPTVEQLLADLLDPSAGVTADAVPQATLPCLAFSFCQACPDGTAQLCFVVRCGTRTTESCGDCIPDCMTFDF